MRVSMCIGWVHVCMCKGVCVCVRVCVGVSAWRMVKRQDNHRFVDCLRKYPITYSSVFSASFKRTSSKNCVVFVTQTSGNRKSAPRSERRKGKASFLRSAGPGCRHSPCSGVRSSSGRLPPSHWKLTCTVC